jgi:hypothetical protein
VQILEQLGVLPFQTDLPIGFDTVRRLHALSRNYELSCYDAAYLELAQRRHLGLATLERFRFNHSLEMNVPEFFPSWKAVDCLLRWRFPPVIPSAARIFCERSRGINAERFLFSCARFAGASLRVDPSARSLRLAPCSLGRDDKRRCPRENRQSLRRGNDRTVVN